MTKICERFAKEYFLFYKVNTHVKSAQRIMFGGFFLSGEGWQQVEEVVKKTVLNCCSFSVFFFCF